MFNDLPGVFDRNFVVGFLLPAVLLVLATILVPSANISTPGMDLSLIPWKFEITHPDQAGIALGLLGLISLFVAILLMTLNRPLVRMLEGYLYPVRWLHPLGRRAYRRFIGKVEAIEQACQHELQANGAVTPGTRKRYRDILAMRCRRYPDQEQFALPTSFGNVIRTAEVYSRVMYGADLIPLWPRLAGVIEPTFRDQLDGARARMDCCVNLFFGALLIMVELLALVYLRHTHVVKVLLPLVATLIGAVGFYNLGVVAATDWGSHLRATSDLYLLPLLSKLGYAAPGSIEDERKLWEGLSRAFLYLESLPDNARCRQDP